MSQTKEEDTRLTFNEVYEPIALKFSTTVTLMLQGKPVLRKYAEAVLRSVSAYADRDYSLETVDVKIVEEELVKSEVAALLAQIQGEYKAAVLGLSGLSEGGAQHKFITAKTERIAKLHEELREVAGDKAIELVVNVLDQMAPPTSPVPSS